MLTVKLNDYSPFIQLNGAAGSQVVQNSGKSYLVGNFILEISVKGNSQQSNPFAIAMGKAIVSPSGTDWQLVQLVPADLNDFQFVFPGIVSFQGSEHSPWCKAAGLQLLNRTSGGLLLSLFSTQFSLDSSKAYQAGIDATVYFTGNNQSSLTGTRTPDNDGDLGFYLTRSGSQLNINAGSILGAPGMKMADFGKGLSLSAVTAGVTFALDMSPAGTAKSSIELSGDKITVATANSGLALERKGLGLNFSIIGTKLVASEKSLSVNGFTGLTRGDETVIALSDQNPLAGNKTRLLTATNNLIFHYPLPDKLGQVDKAYLPQFVYNDPNVKANDTYISTTRRASYYGIQVQDILSDKNAGQIRFDANYAIFDFDYTTQSFSLKAGIDDMHIKGQKVAGCLFAPKQDHANKSGVRLVNIPAGELMLMGQYKLSDYAAPGSSSPLKLDTTSKSNYFALAKPFTQMQPIGISSRAEDNQPISMTTSLAYSKWQLGRQDGNDELFAFDPVSGVIKPQNKWIENYRTQNPATTHQFLNNPGGGIKFEPDDASGLRDTKNFSQLTVSTNGILVYSAVSAGLIYAWLGQQAVPKNQVNVKIAGLSPSSPGVKDLKAGNAWIRFDAYDENGAADPAAQALFKQFIDGNKGPADDSFELKVQPDMGFVLWKKDPANPNGGYCYEKIASTVIFDYSAEMALTATDVRSWKANTLTEYKNESPELWASGNNGSGLLDPTVKDWKGFFFTNLPFSYSPVDADTQNTINKYWLLKTLLDLINKNMMVTYGWMDEKAATFVAGFVSTTGTSLCAGLPFGKLIDFTVNSANVKVRQNIKPVGIELSFSLIFGIFNDYKLDGFGSLSFTNGKAGLIRLYPQAGRDTINNPFPGFDKLIVNSFETDFSNAKLYFKAVPNPSLAAALPFFSTDKPVDGVLTVDLNDKNATTVTAQLTLDSEKNTYFGAFPLAITGITITFKFSGSFEISVDIRCKFKILGQIISGHIKLSEAGLTVELDEVDFNLDFGEAFQIKGMLAWTDTNLVKIPNPLPYNSDLAESASKSTFSGALSLKSDFLLSGFLDGTFLFKTGSSNKLPYYVGAYANSGSINLGVAKINKPAFLIANNADFDGNELTTMAGSVAKNIFSALRPPANTVDTEWIQRWTGNPKIGLTLAGSGFMDFGSAPLTGSPNQTNDGLTSLYFSTGGIFRIDAVVNIFGMDLTVVFALDKINHRISVGVKLPSFSFPDAGNPEFVFSPGLILLEWSYGPPKKYFMVSAAFPELEAQQVLRRNWDNAFKIFVRDMPFPLPNTGWAGFKFVIDGSRITFANAFKVGWTGQGEFLVVKYSFEISFGSVIIYAIDFGSEDLVAETLQPPVFELPETTTIVHFAFNINHDDDVLNSQLLSIINDTMEIMPLAGLKVNIKLRAETFGEIKGSANAVLFGVNIVGASVDAFAALAMCGDTDKGITYLGGTFQFSLSVHILCFTYTVGFDFPLNVIGDSSKCIS